MNGKQRMVAGVLALVITVVVGTVGAAASAEKTPVAASGDEWVPCSDPEHRIPVMCHGAGHGRCGECPTKCSEGHPVACSCCRYAGSVGSVSADNWPDSWNHPGQPAEACKRPGGEGLVPCCNDVAGYTGECGVERPPAPTMPKVPVERGVDTAGLQRL